ncbi:MAG: hypothetical protein KTR35_04490 [Gammaproteobacteria bacterium]|nr:hypothetical protein [Gammaproteobacteria bacterium]
MQRLLSIGIVFALVGFAQSLSAHLMVAQRGTLNITDKGVYMVLSLPASAFADESIDANADTLLQSTEMLEHRLSIMATIKDDVLMICDQQVFSLEGIMLTPVNKGYEDHHHDNSSNSEAADHENSAVVDQLIVMGVFPVLCSEKLPLFFQASLLGEEPAEQLLTVVAKRHNTPKILEFELTPNRNRVKLELTDTKNTDL